MMSEEKKNAVELNDADLDQVSGGTGVEYHAGDGDYVIDEEVCIGCGSCTGSCPVNAIGEGTISYFQIGPACVGCGACESECPVGAIHQY